ncbi:cytosolic carboxypeptidase 2 [Scyliorhinus torazame]
MKLQNWQPEGELESNQNEAKSEHNSNSSTEGDGEARKCTYSFINEHQLLRTRQVVFAYHAGKHIPRLREPHNLYAIASCGPQQAPRWPIECEVIKEHSRHIEWVPPGPEKLYQPTGQEYMPNCVGENGKNTVFCIAGARKGSYFTCSRVGGRRGLVHLATVGATNKDCNALIFESRFESGNLQKALRVGSYEYELTLRTDLYTDKHTQWYYFRVQNTRPGVTYRFTIVNLMKSNSLYNQGLKPLLYSEREAQQRQMGWHRVGKDIRYYKNNLSEEGRSLYSLTWTFQFPHRNDTCYFAHSYPYTYSDLQRYLATIANDPIQSQYCKLRVLCRSLAGNTVHILTITSPSRNQESGPTKKAVVVTARVHPGETNGSWVMTGFLDHILGNSDDAQLLRDMFIFKVVPMLNPDGVITGNYRCSLTGRDLNRNYRTLLRDSFPCVWHTRNMVQRLLEEREVVVYCDFHGHSRKSNAFMYGCNNKETPTLRFRERVFPFMMSKNATDKFSYQSCKFKVQRGKEGTGRVVMWKLGITHSYTMETTFAGSTLGHRRATHFSTEDLKSLGYHFCDTLLDFCDPDNSKFEQCLLDVRAALQRELRRRLEKLGRQYDSDVILSDLSMSDLESSTSGSDSSVSDGPPAHLMSLREKTRQKKKKLRTRKERNRLRQHQLLNVSFLPVQIRHQTAPGEKGTEQGKVQGNTNKSSHTQNVGKLQQTHREQIPTTRPWIPQPISALSVICAIDTKKKAAWFEAMACRWGRMSAPGQKYDQFAWESECSDCRLASITPQRRAMYQRHTLPVSIVDQRQCQELEQEASSSIKQHPPPFNAELECTNALGRRLSTSSWKLGALSLACASSTTVATPQRPQSTWFASDSRPLRTNSRLTSRSAAPHLGEHCGARLLEVPNPAADEFAPKLKLDSSAESDCNQFGEITPLAASSETQMMNMVTDVLLRKNLPTLSDGSKSLGRPEQAHSSSRTSLQDASRRKHKPVGLLTMATSSLVSMDTVLEQKGDVTNIQEGFSKIPSPPEPHLSTLKSSNNAAKRKKLQKLSVKSHRPSVLKGVSGKTAIIHLGNRGLTSGQQLSEGSTTGCTERLGPISSSKSWEMPHRDSECEIQRRGKRNSLVETLKHQLSTVCLWEDTKQSLHSAKVQNSRVAM